jgi:tetratricopeptide (TPR) repeat protein
MRLHLGAWLRRCLVLFALPVPICDGAPQEHACLVITRFGVALQDGEQGEGKQTIPRNSHEFLERGRGWLDKGKMDLAIADLNEAIRLDPKLSEACRLRGTAWNFKGRPDKAMADFNEAIRLDPTSARAYLDRSRARGDGEKDKAMADLNEAIRLDPKLTDTYIRRGFDWYFRGNLDKGISDMSEAIRVDPRSADAYSYRGMFWKAKREYDKAILDYNEAMRLDPESAQTYYFGRGVVWFAKGDLDKALADFGEALRRDPNDPTSHLHRGRIWERIGDYERAIADYGEVLRLVTEGSLAFDALNFRAWIWATCPDARYRDGKKAVESAMRACELTSWSHPDKLDTLAAAYAEVGDFDAAIKLAAWAIELPPQAARDVELSPRAEQKTHADLVSRLALYKAKKPYRAMAKP